MTELLILIAIAGAIGVGSWMINRKKRAKKTPERRQVPRGGRTGTQKGGSLKRD